MKVFVMVVMISLGTRITPTFAETFKPSWSTLSSYIKHFNEFTPSGPVAGNYRKIVGRYYSPEEVDLAYSTLPLTYVNGKEIEQIMSEAAKWAIAKTIKMAKESNLRYYQELINNKDLNAFDWQNVDFSLNKGDEEYCSGCGDARMVSDAYLYGYIKVKEKQFQEISKLFGYSFQDFLSFLRNHHIKNSGLMYGKKEKEGFSDRKTEIPPIGATLRYCMVPEEAEDYFKADIDSLISTGLKRFRSLERVEERKKWYRREFQTFQQGSLNSVYSWSHTMGLSLGKIGYIEAGKFFPWKKDSYYLETGFYCDKWLYPGCWSAVLISKARTLRELGFYLQTLKIEDMKPWLGIEVRISEKKVVVTKVFLGSAAEAMGMKKGDVIERLNGQSIYYPDGSEPLKNLKQRIKEVSRFSRGESGNPGCCDVSRNGRWIYLDETRGFSLKEKKKISPGSF